MLHFNWTELIPGVVPHCSAGSHCVNYIHVATFVVGSLLLLIVGLAARLALGSGEKSILPASQISLKGFFETIVEFIVNVSDMVIGVEGRKFVPMFCAVFFFILFQNLIGLIPGMTASTDEINTTFAMGAFMFLVYNYHGFREHGIKYLMQFFGPKMPNVFLMILIVPMMLVIELVSHTVRPLSLGLRLYGNMMGDHKVLGAFLDLAPYVVPTLFYGLGLFVCLMQAFVFTMLSMVYVSFAISHDH
jgi:F-type H+-transporting ATPase subunit a